MRSNVGKSIYFNHLFVDSTVKRFSVEKDGSSHQQTFGDLLALRDPAFTQIKNQFNHRINKLFLHPKLGDLLDNNEIDFAIMHVFEQLYTTSGG